MASVTFKTPSGSVTVSYSLAAGVAATKTFVLNMRFGQWLGDMGNATHQWNEGDPDLGRRHGDHTAWSSDGPAGVVKAFDWKPPDEAAGMVRFKTWLLPQLRAGRYRGVCKFINLNNGQYSGTGAYQGWSGDDHLHWSYLSTAAKSAVNPLEDYYREVIAPEDDMELSDSMAPYKGVGTVGTNIVSTLDYARKAAGLSGKIDALLAASGAEVERDAEVRTELAEIKEQVAAIQAGDPEALAKLLGDRLSADYIAALENIRITIEPDAT
jgi:hypothetical protein